MINVLQITVGGNEYTGVASFLIQYYSHIDKGQVHFDFLFCRENSMVLQNDNPVLKDSVMYEMRAIKENGQMDYFSLYKGLRGILLEKSYDVVHINTSSIMTTFICVIAAKKARVETIVAHSHNNGVGRTTSKKKEGYITKLLKDICKVVVIKESDWLFGCSQSAGEYLFGRKAIKLDKFCVIKNAIDTDAYIFNSQERARLRKEKDIEDDYLVLGHVGRISPQKNHELIVDAFKELHSLYPKSYLWLVGDGENKQRIIQRIQNYGLTNSVIFWGQRKDVPRLMQGMDVFIFPSISEGFGLVAVEAEAAGLPVVASDKVPKDIDITDLVTHVELSKEPREWAEIILEQYLSNKERKNTNEIIKQSGYDITEASKWLQNFYINFVN